MSEPKPEYNVGGSAPAPRDFGAEHHVYGGKAALTFQDSFTRSGGVPTLMIDAAPSNGVRSYDWANKICVQLTWGELPFVAAVFMGLKPSCEYSNHGDENNKGFSFANQESGIFCRVFGPGKAHAVPISAPDVYAVTALLVNRIILGNDCVKTFSDAVALVRHTVCRFNK